MIHVEAPSRLHFGLFSLPGEQLHAGAWDNSRARHFGGVGLMVERPGIALTVAPAAAWSAEGPGAQRALAFAQALASAKGLDQPFDIRVERCSAEHVGLGTGTQLGLAVALAITRALGLPDPQPPQIAASLGRGRRSAIGIHGFMHGGLLVEAGKRDASQVSPLVARQPFPEDWLVVLVLPHQLQGAHGTREVDAFCRLAQLREDPARTDSLCRLVLLGMLPAVIERDCSAFGEALYEFNRRVGEMFRPWQGDVYAEPQIAELIRSLRGIGIQGVGQSSWGPTVFAVTAHETQAAELCKWLKVKHGLHDEEVIVTRARNSGQCIPEGRLL